MVGPWSGPVSTGIAPTLSVGRAMQSFSRVLEEWEALGRPIFRPSERRDWQQCPMRRALRWGLAIPGKAVIPRPLQWTPWVAVGMAIHAGLATVYRGGQETEGQEKAREVLEREYVENPDWSLSALGKLVGKAIKAALEVNMLSWGTPLVVDPDHDKPHPVLGACHPDLILETPPGDVIIVDIKTTEKLNTAWEFRRLRALETDDQWWQYAWHVQEFMRKPVQVTNGLVAHLIVLTPTVRSFTHAWDCEHHVLARWAEQAIRDWVEMEKERLGMVPPTWRLAGCETKYGPCPYYDLHFTYRDNWEIAKDYYDLHLLDEWRDNAGH